jgi:hypothetical protein
MVIFLAWGLLSTKIAKTLHHNLDRVRRSTSIAYLRIFNCARTLKHEQFKLNLELFLKSFFQITSLASESDV